MTQSPIHRQKWTPYALTGTGGVLYFLGWAGFDVWPLELICLVPLWIALELGLDRRPTHSLLIGWLYGTIRFAGGYHWLISFFELFSGYGIVPSVVFWLVFCTYLGGQYALYGLFYGILRKRGWSTVWVAIPPILLLEWLYPRLFPSYLATAFYRQTHFIQMADLGGPLLVSALLACINLAIYETLRWVTRQRRAPVSLLVFTSACIALAIGYGSFRIAEITSRMSKARSLQVGVVQVDMGIFEKRQDAEEGHRRHLEQTRQLLKSGKLDLVVWPESAYMGRLPRELPFSATSVQHDLNVPILFGSLSTPFKQGNRKIYNTAFLVDANGQVHESYDKTFLLAFGEYLPLGEIFPFLYDLSPNSGRFTRGDHVRPLHLGGYRISTPICYEDILPDFTRHMVAEANPHVLINLTNDSWFGDTQEPWIHLAMAEFRAIEHRRFLVRATNSGVSAVVDPLGRVVANTGVNTRENLRYDVAMLDGNTLYTRLGPWPGWLSLFAIAFMLFTRPKQAK